MVDRSVQCKDGVSDSAQVLPLKKIVCLENVGFVNSILHHRCLKTIYKFWSLTHHIEHSQILRIMVPMICRCKKDKPAAQQCSPSA